MPDADPHRREPRTRSPGSGSCIPDRRNYLDVYDHYGLLGRRAVFGARHLAGRGRAAARCHDSGAAIAHCPTSNFFLGSGAFDLARRARTRAAGARRARHRSSAPARRSRSWRTLGEAYKVAQLNGQPLSAGQHTISPPAAAPAPSYLDDRIGSIAPGLEADLVVLDLRSTPLIDFRMNQAEALIEAALHPDDPGRRPRRAGDLCGGPVGLPAALFRSG